MPTTFLLAIPDFRPSAIRPVRHPCGNHIGSRYMYASLKTHLALLLGAK